MFGRLITTFLAIVLVMCPVWGVHAGSRLRSIETALVAPEKLTADQLDNLLAPIALYPDPILAQIFPASTFVEQIDQAARYLRGNNDSPAGVDDLDWDVSVKSLAHYPPVVYQMAQKLDWTTAIGQAFIEQGTDVFDSVQRLRNRSQDGGYLQSTPQQTIVEENDIIEIEPANATEMYLPIYDPGWAYGAASPERIRFGRALAIGAWLNNDCNWGTRSVYRHGWQGTGWVALSSTVIHRTLSNPYLNNRNSSINVNRDVIHRGVNYNNVSRYASVNRTVNYDNVDAIKINQANRELIRANENNLNRVNNDILSRNVPGYNAHNNAYRGRRGDRSPRQSGFDGAGDALRARRESGRGQASRASAAAVRGPQPATGGGRMGGGRRR